MNSVRTQIWTKKKLVGKFLSFLHAFIRCDLEFSSMGKHCLSGNRGRQRWLSIFDVMLLHIHSHNEERKARVSQVTISVSIKHAVSTFFACVWLRHFITRACSHDHMTVVPCSSIFHHTSSVVADFHSVYKMRTMLQSGRSRVLEPMTWMNFLQFT
jgi:hypothetical protein